MSAEREVVSLWSRCAAVRRRLEAPDAPSGRLLDDLIEELDSATRRLRSAGMLTDPRAGHLREASEALSGARFGRGAAGTAVARCAESLERLAASFHIPLPGEPVPSPAAFDYDTEPGRFRTASEVTRRYSTRGDIHGPVAARIAAEGALPAVDAGCGEGRLLRLLVDSGIEAIGVDRSPTMLGEAPGRRVLGDVRALPLRDGSAGVVASLYVLNHLADPEAAVAEAWRVLRPGGLYVVSAVSRHDSPEIADLLPPAPPPTFDAELAPGLLAARGFDVEVEPWDAPGGLVLPDTAAIRAYLTGRILPPAVADRAARAVAAPLRVTRRGALVWGRRPG